ncbi:MAG TPA: hypothetical protein VJL87_00840 [Bdellovibrionota bacterium]|nr:hypothetical protein [Bdellovibrionota bacterium]
MSLFKNRYFLSWLLIFLFIVSFAFSKITLAGDRTKAELLNQVAQEYINWRRLIDTGILAKPLVLDPLNETDTFFKFFFGNTYSIDVLGLDVMASPWSISKILLLDIHYSDFESIALQISNSGYPVDLAKSPYTYIEGVPIGEDPEAIFNSFLKKAKTLFTKTARSRVVEVPRRVLTLTNGSYSLSELTAETVSFSLRALSSSTLEEALNLIATAPNGRNVLRKIFQKLDSSELAIKEFDINVFFKEAGSKYRCDVGAFITKGETPQVLYVDTLREVGTISQNLIHEMTHSLDEESKTEFRNLEAKLRDFNKQLHDSQENPGGATPRTEADKKKLERGISVYRFKTERKAYDADASFVRELIKQFPHLASYFDESEIEKTDDFIIRNYKLDREAVEEYLNNTPLTPEEEDKLLKKLGPQRQGFTGILSCCP